MLKKSKLERKLIEFRKTLSGKSRTELKNIIIEEKREINELNSQHEKYREILYAQGELIKNHEFDILKATVEAIEARDPYTRGHSERVTRFAVLIGKVLGFSETEINKLHKAGHLHDIGKIYWDRADFSKINLTLKDKNRIKQHPIIGVKYLRHIGKFPEIYNIIRHHHERYDRKGYPDGLSGKEIDELAGSLALADAFDAITSDRLYRGKKPITAAIEEIKRCSGMDYDGKKILKYFKDDKGPELQFVPEIAEAFLYIKTVGSKNSKKVHKIGCPYMHKIDSLELIINPKGKVPCKFCKPYR